MSDPFKYTIGWICTTTTEYFAAKCLLDEEHPLPANIPSRDNNTYVLGRMGTHNVVIAVLPAGMYGTGSSAVVAGDLPQRFPNIRAYLMVGIGGGAPSAKHDIRLGDVVVSTPRDNHGGVIQYDFGETIDDGAFKVTGFLAPPPAALWSAASGAREEFEMTGNGIKEAVTTVLTRFPALEEIIGRPSPETDILYHSYVVFDPSRPSTDVGPDAVVSRPDRYHPEVHYGLIASSNRIMKDATARDKLAMDQDVLCFEMEAAGLMSHFPCVVVKGICDYSDSHGNKDWQGYAALTAAACAKAIICRISETTLKKEKRRERRVAVGNAIFMASMAATAAIDPTGISLLTFLGASAAEINRSAYWTKTHFDMTTIQKLHVAIDAEYDAPDNHPGQICHPKTRFDLLQEVQAWTESSTSPPVFWLYGRAGHGKSTVARTVAKRLDEQKILGATFFFKRGNTGRSSASNLISTIAKQLARRQRKLLPHIARAIKETSDISSRTIEEQFSKLIVGPLKASGAYSSKDQRLLVVLDALDECSVDEDVEVVVTLLRSLVKYKETGIKIFVTSRPAIALPDGIDSLWGLREEFQTHNLSSRYSIHEIDAVLQDMIRMAKLEWNHKLPSSLANSNINLIPPEWPSISDTERLAMMTNGRFDTAVAVGGFIQDFQVGSPLVSLQRLLNLATKEEIENLVRALPAYAELKNLLPNPYKPGTDVSAASVIMPSDTMSESDMYSRTTVVDRNFSDFASVNSLSSAGSSIGLPHDILQSCISYIGDNILDAIGDTTWFHTAFKYHSASKIQQCLHALLRDFSTSLEEEIPSKNDKLPRTATRIIRRCGQKISTHICNRAEIWLEHIEYLNGVYFERLPLMTGEQLSIQEIMGLFDKDSAEHGPNNDDQRDTDDDDSQPDEHDNTIDLHSLKNLLFCGPAFANLCSAIKEALYNSDPPHMRYIENLIQDSLKQLPPKVCENCQSVGLLPIHKSEANICVDHTFPNSVTLQTDWKALEFLHTEFEREVPSLGAVITYTGLASEAFATTCSQYLNQFWPSNSTALLDALDSLLLSRRMSNTEQLHGNTASPATSPKYAVKASLSDSGEVSIEARGTAEFLIQIAQQITWITSALRSSTTNKDMHLGYSLIQEDDEPEEETASRLKYCFATLSPMPGTNAGGSSGGDLNFAITCRFQEIPEAERSCWFDLVSSGAVIAANFPVPARHDEKGLEIPMGILAKIAVIQDAIEYKGGIVMKGPTSMLVPIKRNPKLDIIQWHVVSASKKRKRLTYLEGVEKCKQRALLDEVDLQSFLQGRHIVGWWGQAKSRLGDEDINFNNLTWSRAKSYQPLGIQNIAAGLQQIGVLNVEFTPGRKDSGYLVKFEGPYGEMLRTARGEKAFLYDTDQQRAWLVTWDEVILHIIRKRNSERPFVCNGDLVKIQPIGSAMQSLLVNRKLVLVDDEDEPETLCLMAKRIFHQLETLAAMDDNRRHEPEKAVDISDVLIGHEFMSIVNRTVGRETKKTEIRTTSGGWARLVQDSASLVLFAKGFDDLIRPTINTETLCTRWKTVPWGKDYLAATTDTLLRLYFKGNEVSQEYLTSSGLCWHKDHSVKLFEKCPEPASNECGCSRLQQIVPKPMSIGAVDRPRPVSAGGAVIFGVENVMAKLTLPTVLRMKKDAAMYSQPNLQIEGKVTSENGALGQVEEDKVVLQQLPRKLPLGIESGSITMAQKDCSVLLNDSSEEDVDKLCIVGSVPTRELRTKKRWTKRVVNGDTLASRENVSKGKHQKH